ncbi:MAG: hypothetical protein PF692_06250 [Kiritimatiellae bacterium]|jgi:hypothetical protein|nr:hypothetical protein [Kiritimatiellia bacterium]
MRGPQLVKWEDKIVAIFKEIDRFLEDKYGDMFPLHPSRAKEGVTAHPKYDGLFAVDGVFTAGYGSKYGAGYIFRINYATLSKVPEDLKDKIEQEAIEMLKKALKETFPDKDLKVSIDKEVYKIHGDLSL